MKAILLRVLRSDGSVRHDGELIPPAAPILSYVEWAQLKIACERRLQEVIQKGNTRPL